jgi:hypothetical protein
MMLLSQSVMSHLPFFPKAIRKDSGGHPSDGAFSKFDRIVDNDASTYDSYAWAKTTFMQ